MHKCLKRRELILNKFFKAVVLPFYAKMPEKKGIDLKQVFQGWSLAYLCTNAWNLGNSALLCKVIALSIIQQISKTQVINFPLLFQDYSLFMEKMPKIRQLILHYSSRLKSCLFMQEMPKKKASNCALFFQG